MTAGAVFMLAFVPMIIEAALSARHEAGLRAAGAREPAADVFRAMQLAYPSAFLLMVVEGIWRQPAFDQMFAIGLATFIGAKALKYWTMWTLGPRWTFRVLVPPDSTRVVSGPYRFHRHPNYLAVIGELLGMAFMTHALVTGPLGTLAFGLLIRRRIGVEERALGV